MFLASQGMAWISAECSILGGCLADGDQTVIRRINKLVRLCHETADVEVVFRPLANLVVALWTDAA